MMRGIEQDEESLGSARATILPPAQIRSLPSNDLSIVSEPAEITEFIVVTTLAIECSG
jgi:hypothetical protein